MSLEPEDNRFAPPRSSVDEVEPPWPGRVTLASRSSRFGAAVIDMLIAMAVMWLISRVTPWDAFNDDGDAWDIHLGDAIGNFLCYFIPNAYLLITRAQTIGKAMVGIRVVRRDGTPASFIRLVCVREGIPSLLGVAQPVAEMFWLIDSLFIFRASRRCLHDDLADTVVIQL